jgi:hypothetical protein
MYRYRTKSHRSASTIPNCCSGYAFQGHPVVLDIEGPNNKGIQETFAQQICTYSSDGCSQARSVRYVGDGTNFFLRFFLAYIQPFSSTRIALCSLIFKTRMCSRCANDFVSVRVIKSSRSGFNEAC